MASSATAVWSLAGRSNVEEMTSPLTERSKSVTSSGRSSTSTTIRWHSGLLAVIEFAIDFMIIVLPALAGETIRPRWPLPIGAAMSMTRPMRFVDSVSRRSRSEAYSGVSFWNSMRPLAASGSAPLMVSIRTSGLNFSLRSPSRGWRTCPVTASPRRRPYLRTIESET